MLSEKETLNNFGATAIRYAARQDLLITQVGLPRRNEASSKRKNGRQGLSKFSKTTLQYEGDDDEDAMLFFLEIRKYGQS